MRRTSLAVCLSTLLLLSWPGLASAQPPSYWTWGSGNGATCGANLTAFLHQHGPLFNYGPYYGYPPFEPYGPWNAYLQYNPWYYGYGQGGCSKCPDRDLSGHGGLGWSPSWHSSWLHGGWFHGCSTCGCGGVFPSHLFHHDSLPCPCETIAPGDAKAVSSRPVTNLEIVDPVTRCAGVGHPLEFAGFYRDLPALELRASQPGETSK